MAFEKSFERPLYSEAAVVETNDQLSSILDGFRFGIDETEHSYFKGGNNRYGVIIPLSSESQPNTYTDGFMYRFSIMQSPKIKAITLATIDGTGPKNKDAWHIRMQFSKSMPTVINPEGLTHLVLDEWVIPDRINNKRLTKGPSGMPIGAVPIEHLAFGGSSRTNSAELEKLSDATDLFKRAAEIHHATRSPNVAMWGLAYTIKNLRAPVEDTYRVQSFPTS